MVVSQLGGPPSGISSWALPLYWSLKLPALRIADALGFLCPPGCRLGPGTKWEKQRGREEKGEGRKCGFYLSSDDCINKLNGSACV